MLSDESDPTHSNINFISSTLFGCSTCIDLDSIAKSLLFTQERECVGAFILHIAFEPIEFFQPNA